MNEKPHAKLDEELVRSVIDDGKNLVGHGVPIGTRIEAGVDLAADVSSFILGPEDAATERAVVLAIHEAIDHYPAFARTMHLLEKAGHQIVERQLERGLIETKHALYKIIEHGPIPDDDAVREVAAAGRNAFEKGKLFVVHALKLPEALERKIEKLGRVATSELEVERSIAAAERGSDLLSAKGERRHGSVPVLRSLPDGTQRLQELREPLAQAGRILSADTERITQDIGRGHTFTYRTADVLRDPQSAALQLQTLRDAAENHESVSIGIKHEQTEILQANPTLERGRERAN